MRFRELPSSIARIASGFPKAIFCVAAALSLASCEKRSETPDWDTPGGTPAPVGIAPTAAPSAATTRKTPAPAVEVASDGLRFINYNVENWLTMDRRPLKDAPKPENQKRAVIDILSRHSPDIVGLCEIGTPGDLAEIQTLLKDAGVDLPHAHHAGGTDPVRHLGLLSRFPITSTNRFTGLEYHLDGRLFGFNRGILDATVTARDRSYRFLGVHLKSKREVKEGDQEAMRLSEARLLRRHIDSILNDDPAARLVVYGDFNDSRQSPTGRAVTGSFNEPGYLTAIRARDSRNHSWTYFWEYHEIYSRIDFVTVTKALRAEVDFEASYLIEDPEWEDASDHRPIMAIFR